jgi:hypothetical protein
MVTGMEFFLYSGVYGDATGMNVEFGGEGVRILRYPSARDSYDVRRDNAEFAIFPCDDK